MEKMFIISFLQVTDSHVPPPEKTRKSLVVISPRKELNHSQCPMEIFYFNF